MAPVMMPTKAGPRNDTIGSMAGRRAWRSTMARVDSPLARAVRMYGLLSTSIIAPRVMRAMLDT